MLTFDKEVSVTTESADDWRHWATTTLASDVPAAFPGGPSHKAGARVYVATLTKDSYGRVVAFCMPSPTALALSISIRSAEAAEQLRGGLTFEKGVSPLGPSRSVPNSASSQLYDFFERCMQSVTFAVNAIEIFCNQTLADELRDGATYTHETRKGEEELDATTAQRNLSIEEKVGTALPDLLSVPSPRGKAAWSDLKVLLRVRNSTVHMKAEEAYKGDLSAEIRTLFHEFFVAKSILAFPANAVEVLGAIQKPGKPEPSWLEAARAQLMLARAQK
jgi:hypothetical protein